MNAQSKTISPQFIEELSQQITTLKKHLETEAKYDMVPLPGKNAFQICKFSAAKNVAEHFRQLDQIYEELQVLFSGTEFPTSVSAALSESVASGRRILEDFDLVERDSAALAMLKSMNSSASIEHQMLLLRDHRRQLTDLLREHDVATEAATRVKREETERLKRESDEFAKKIAEDNRRREEQRLADEQKFKEDILEQRRKAHEENTERWRRRMGF